MICGLELDRTTKTGTKDKPHRKRLTPRSSLPPELRSPTVKWGNVKPVDVDTEGAVLDEFALGVRV